MANFIKKVNHWRQWWLILAIIFILLLGNYLRTFSYASVPHPGETADEYSFGWLGLSLIKDHYPIAWSGISGYNNHDYQKINVDSLFDKEPSRLPFPIDKPWFDHPPLFGILTGGYAYSKGVRDFVDASVGILRRPMLKIGILTTLLIMVLAWQVLNWKVALLSGLFYSIIPTFVISSRLALAENGYLPIYLIAIILAVIYFKKQHRWLWLAASVFAGVGVLFKISAIAIGISLLLSALFLGGREWKKLFLITIIVSVILPLCFFAIYGLIFGWETFTAVLQANANRFYGSGSEIFYSLLTAGKITTNRNLTDGWLILSWLSFVTIFWRDFHINKHIKILGLTIISYLVVFLLLGSEPYGWYRFPFYPFLTIFLASLLIDLIKKGSGLLYFPLLLLPFGTAIHRLMGIVEFQKYVQPFRILIISFFTISLIALLRNGKRMNFTLRLFMISFLILTIWVSAKLILFYDYNQWFFVT